MRNVIYGEEEVNKLKKKAINSMLGDVHGLMGKSLFPKKEGEDMPKGSMGPGKSYVVEKSEAGVLMPKAAKGVLGEEDHELHESNKFGGNSSDQDAEEKSENIAEKAAIAGGKMADMANKARMSKSLGLESPEELEDPSKVEKKSGELVKFRVMTDDDEIEVGKDIYEALQKAQSEDPEAQFPDIEVNGKRMKVKGLGGNRMNIYKKK